MVDIVQRTEAIGGRPHKVKTQSPRPTPGYKVCDTIGVGKQNICKSIGHKSLHNQNLG